MCSQKEQQKREVTFPQTITIRANRCSDQQRWGFGSITKKSRHKSDQHATEHGFTVSAIGIECDVDTVHNTITVKRKFEGDEFDWYHHRRPGVIVTCNHCRRVTVIYFDHFGQWTIAEPLVGYRQQVTLHWSSKLPYDQRTWHNIKSVGFETSGFYPYSDGRCVHCLTDLPDELLTYGNPEYYPWGKIPVQLMSDFWEAYVSARDSQAFAASFNRWNVNLSDRFRQVMLDIQARRERADEQLQVLAEANANAARVIYGMKDIDMSDGKPVRSRKLQQARTQLEEARKNAGFGPIKYDQDKKKVVA
ncbi:MAG: hypothetical protein ACOYUK_05015 [Patescibacteria group bacterium]